ncbi:MAG: hypothetical protein LW821_04185 [Flammeovirgaceae bacterium]|jgi:hypothetical protein|nr:hypothetical protein [Flammeovirgaceae bacterium]
MGFIEKYIVGREIKWKWFGFTLLGGFIPLITTLIFGPSSEGYFKSEDIVFLGLTMCISNINIVGGIEFPQKDVLILLSVAFMVVFCLCLGKIASKSEVTFIFESFVYVAAVISIWLNYHVNNYVLKVNNKNGN